jgi:tetratricopeptide (TPR) repeat protein
VGGRQPGSHGATHARARELYARALTIRRAHLGPTHRDVGQVLNGLGISCLDAREWKQAEAQFKQVIEVAEACSDLSINGAALHNLGMVYENMGQRANAIKYYGEALKTLQRAGVPWMVNQARRDLKRMGVNADDDENDDPETESDSETD